MSDLLSAVGILLAIITLFYEKASNAIKPVLEKSIPPNEQKIELEKTRKEIERGIRTVIIFVVIYFAFSWLLFPTSIVVIFHSKLSLWDFDAVNTIFIIVNCTVFIFFIASIRTLILLFIKRKKCLTNAST
jgi:hypothetical protein